MVKGHSGYFLFPALFIEAAVFILRLDELFNIPKNIIIILFLNMALFEVFSLIIDFRYLL
jgi:hypothetical protein